MQTLIFTLISDLTCNLYFVKSFFTQIGQFSSSFLKRLSSSPLDNHAESEISLEDHA